MPEGAIPFAPPPGISPLRFTCCDGSIEVRYLPDGFTQAQFNAAAQSIADAAAVKLAGCIGDQYNQLHARRPACTIANPSPLPEGTVGVPYSVVLTQTGATAPVTWTRISGSLPDGLHLSSGGVISGTPTVSASFGFVVRATSPSTSTTCVKLFTLTVTSCDTADWCNDPMDCRLRVKDFNQADWTYVWDGNLDEFSAAIPPGLPCVGYHDGDSAGIQYSVGLAKWRFNILCPDLSVYLANGPAGPQGTSPVGVYTFDVSSDPTCIGPASFELEAYTPP